MKHIRTFESYRIQKNREEIIRESVLQVNDIYKVKTMVDVPRSLINAYIKKVKDETAKNPKDFFGDVDIAEEIVKYITTNNLDIEKLPSDVLMGGGTPQTTEPAAEPQAQTEPAPAPVEAAPAEETPAADEFEEPAPAEEAPAAEEPTTEEPATEELPAEEETPSEEETEEETEEPL